MLAREKMLKSMDKQLLLLALMPMPARMGALKLMVKQLGQVAREMEQDGRPRDPNAAPELFNPFQAIGSAAGPAGPEGSDGATPPPAENIATSKGAAEEASDGAVDGTAGTEKEAEAIGPEIAAVGRMVSSMEVAFGKLQDHDGWMEARRDEFDHSMDVANEIALKHIQRLLDRIKALAGIHVPAPGGTAGGTLPGSGESSTASGGDNPA